MVVVFGHEFHTEVIRETPVACAWSGVWAFSQRSLHHVDKMMPFAAFGLKPEHLASFATPVLGCNATLQINTSKAALGYEQTNGGKFTALREGAAKLIPANLQLW